MANWRLRQDGQEYGPFSSDQLKQLASAGRIGHDSEIQKEGNTEWHPVSRMKGLAIIPTASIPTRPRALPVKRHEPMIAASSDDDSHIMMTQSYVSPNRGVATHVNVYNRTNGLGTAAFVTSIVALLSLGCLSPVSLIFSLVALANKPRGMALAGLVLSLIGLAPFAFIVMTVVTGAAMAPIVAKIPKPNSVDSKSNDEAYFKEPVGASTAALSVEVVSVRQVISPQGSTQIIATVANHTGSPVSHLEIDVAFHGGGERLAFDRMPLLFWQPAIIRQKPG